MEIDRERQDAAASGGPAPTYEFRWDVEVPLGDRRLGEKFMKQWRRVLQAQRLSPLVSPKLAPRSARFQLCCTAGDVGSAQVQAREAAIAEELARLPWPAGADDPATAAAAGRIAGEPAGTHPAGWQGVRVWMTFARQDVDAVLGKAPRLP